MRNQLSDPSWKRGPTGPTHSDHWTEAALREADLYDVDGPSVTQAEQTDGEVLVTIREGWLCQRDGCDADTIVDHVYAYDDIDSDVQTQLEDHFGVTGVELYERCSENITIVDHDGEHPYVGIECGDETVGYVAPQWSEKDKAYGGCNGTVDEATRLGI